MTTHKGLWRSLETLPRPAAVLEEWRALTGNDFDAVRFYLAPTDDLAESFPCTNTNPCECRHSIIFHGPSNIVAACRCGGGDCPPIRLTPTDLIVYALNTRKLGDAIRYAFGFQTADASVNYRALASHRIGSHGTLHSPVYFHCPHEEAALLREIEVLLNGAANPFILVTPSRGHYTATVEGAVSRAGCLLIPCSMTLAVEPGGKLRVTNPIEPLLADFTTRQTTGAALTKTVETIGRDLHAVVTNTYELRRENEELKALAEGGFLRFATRVEADDFRAFAAIMLTGNRSQAAQALNNATRTFYDRVDTWPTRGSVYKRMFRMTEWRKKQGRKIKVRLEDSLLGTEVEDQPENPGTIADVLAAMRDKSDTGSPDNLLRDILDAIARQNADNWQEVQTELIDILRDELPQ
jgi:hypothetical protein